MDTWMQLVVEMYKQANLDYKESNVSVKIPVCLGQRYG